MSITAKVKGTQKLIANLRAISAESERLSNAIVGAAADKITTKQKQSAPADLGTIKQNLGNVKLEMSLYAIFSNAPESPYQEFGTGPQVSVPAQWADVAAQFKGKSGGSWQDFIIALTDWVKRHGGARSATYSVKTQKRTGNRLDNNDADTQAAWLIARAILRRGLKPQQFFFGAIEQGFKDMEKTLKTGLEQMHNKYKKL